MHNLSYQGCDVYPSKNTMKKVKAGSYPKIMSFTEEGARADLISLLENTVTKILLLINKKKWKDICKSDLLLEGKWGMDGASGQQTTRQKWSDDSVNEDLIEEEVEDIYVEEIEIFGEVLDTEAAAVKNISEKSDKTVFSISFVPLQLKANGDLIWVNETPSSVYYCRPIKFEFTKEETDYVRRQYEYYTEILEKEEHYTFKIEEYNFKIKYDLKCTMIDGKICNMLTNQRSTRSCNICKVGPSNINNLHYIYENCKFEESFYRFGISTLHC